MRGRFSGKFAVYLLGLWLFGLATTFAGPKDQALKFRIFGVSSSRQIERIKAETPGLAHLLENFYRRMRLGSITEPVRRSGRAQSRYDKLQAYAQAGWIIGADVLETRFQHLDRNSSSGGARGEFNAILSAIEAGYVVELLPEAYQQLEVNTGLRGKEKGPGYPDFRIFKPEELQTLDRLNYPRLGTLLEVKSFGRIELTKKDIRSRFLRANTQIRNSPYYFPGQEPILQLELLGEHTPQELTLLDETITELLGGKEKLVIRKVQVRYNGRALWDYDRKEFQQSKKSALRASRCSKAMSSTLSGAR